jgi:hypothetical protein
MDHFQHQKLSSFLIVVVGIAEKTTAVVLI